MSAPETNLGIQTIVSSCALLVLAAAAACEEPSTYSDSVRPTLERYCFECHGRGKKKGDLDLEHLEFRLDLPTPAAAWEEVADLLEAREMPPAKADQPSLEERASLVAWLRRALAAAGRERPPVDGRDPGRVTMRRMNRFEYRNTVRDLLGVDYAPADDFPSDDVGYGFDNIGDVLSLSPLLFERYLEAAEAIAGEAIVTEDPTNPEVRHFEAEDVASTAKGGVHRGMRNLSTTGAVIADTALPRDGVYRIRVRACGQQAGPDPCMMEVQLGGKRVRMFEVEARPDEPRVYQVEASATAGATRLSAAFTNDYYQPDDPDPTQRDRNLMIDWMEVVGPVDGLLELPVSHGRVMICTPAEPTEWRRCARSILEHLASRAFRRPARRSEVRRLLSLVGGAIERGDSFPEAIQLALQAVLVAPSFLFRPEPPEAAGGAEVAPVTEHALASRLSYFLWSSMPDDRLLQLADAGELRGVLEQEVPRMLADPRASALVDGFAEQWLQLRQLDLVTPDPDRFPTFDEALRHDMRRETEMLFEAMVWQDQSVITLLAPSFTYLNEHLAQHYGIEGVRGDRFRPVATGQSGRGGILTQASILTLTSYPTRTSPVKRGKWILEQILDEPPPPPPPGVPDLPERIAEKSATVRERMQAHRTNPDCASCHAKMDPLGFALERYDAIGRMRERDAEHEIDDRGELPDGRVFRGAGELVAVLAADGAFVRCFTRKLLTYALGRGLEDADEAAVARIVEFAAAEDNRFSAFIRGIVTSRPFLYQRARRSADEGY